MNPGTFIKYAYGTATLPEIVWTIVSLLGLILTLAVLREAYLDRAALYRSPLFVAGGDRHDLANQAIRNTTCILSLFTLFLSAGVAGCLTPNAPGDKPTPYGIVLAVVFLCANGICVYASYTNRRDRIVFLRRLRSRRADMALRISMVPPVRAEREEGT